MTSHLGLLLRRLVGLSLGEHLLKLVFYNFEEVVNWKSLTAAILVVKRVILVDFKLYFLKKMLFLGFDSKLIENNIFIYLSCWPPEVRVELKKLFYYVYDSFVGSRHQVLENSFFSLLDLQGLDVLFSCFLSDVWEINWRLFSQKI